MIINLIHAVPSSCSHFLLSARYSQTRLPLRLSDRNAPPTLLRITPSI